MKPVGVEQGALGSLGAMNIATGAEQNSASAQFALSDAEGTSYHPGTSPAEAIGAEHIPFQIPKTLLDSPSTGDAARPTLKASDDNTLPPGNSGSESGKKVWSDSKIAIALSEYKIDETMLMMDMSAAELIGRISGADRKSYLYPFKFGDEVISAALLNAHSKEWEIPGDMANMVGANDLMSKAARGMGVDYVRMFLRMRFAQNTYLREYAGVSRGKPRYPIIIKRGETKLKLPRVKRDPPARDYAGRNRAGRVSRNFILSQIVTRINDPESLRSLEREFIIAFGDRSGEVGFMSDVVKKWLFEAENGELLEYVKYLGSRPIKKKQHKLKRTRGAQKMVDDAGMARALHSFDGNISAVARALGYSRTQVYSRISSSAEDSPLYAFKKKKTGKR